MGFRAGSYATVWDVQEGRSGKFTKCRISISRKDKTTDENVQDFGGFCMFIGSAHEKARRLKPKDRIRIIECDVSNRYDKETQKEYTDFKVFDFEPAQPFTQGQSGSKGEARKLVELPEVDEGADDEDTLPF